MGPSSVGSRLAWNQLRASDAPTRPHILNLQDFSNHGRISAARFLNAHLSNARTLGTRCISRGDCYLFVGECVRRDGGFAWWRAGRGIAIGACARTVALGACP